MAFASDGRVNSGFRRDSAMKRFCWVAVLFRHRRLRQRTSDPAENLKWHLSKAFKDHPDGITFVTQVDSEWSKRHAGKWRKQVISLSEADANVNVEATDSSSSPYAATVSLTPKTVDYEYCNSQEAAEKATNVRQSHKSFTYKATYKHDGKKSGVTGIECHLSSRSSDRDVSIPPEAEGRLSRIFGAVQ